MGEHVNKTGMEPDDGFKHPVTEEPEADAEGHALWAGKGFDDAGLEPEGVIKAIDEPAERQPTDPDSARYSDRNLKVAVVPVAW